MSWLISAALISCLLGGLIWKGYQLSRQPWNLPLQGIVGFLAFALIGRILRDVVGDASLVRGGPVWSAVAWHAPTSAAVLSLLFFFDAATLPRQVAKRRTRRNVLVLLAAEVVMIGAAILAPAPMSIPYMSVIYFAANAFMGCALAACAISALRYARQAERRLALGLRVAAVGFALTAVTSGIFAAIDVEYWFTGTLFMNIIGVNGTLSFTGIVAIVAGLLYPAARMRLTAIRIWWRQRQAYHALGPLWTALHHAFPEDEFLRASTTPWDSLRVWDVHRRYYRRMIECRDGLVRISPRVAKLREDHPADTPLSDLIAEALQGSPDDHGDHQRAVPLAIPYTNSAHDEVDELIALSRAFAATRSATSGRAA
ncbi:MAB_1171c family putative transporter [Amycolatopsis sp. NPDC057786]|uniref:MAB_1171c family putative transporter n=1 Tax=Amycolatopsis sp. NPDC057786 TaxID=3346250 RepID=UPI00366FFB47